MDGVVATAPDPIISGFPGIFTLLEARANTTPQERLKRLANLPLGQRPPLVVCLNAPELHIRVIWGTQFVTLSFAQPTPEDEKVLAFARDIRLGMLPATVVVHPEWITSGEVAAPQATEMEAPLALLAPGHPRLAAETLRPETGFCNLGVPFPPLPGALADGLPFPGAVDCVAYDGREG